DKVVIRGAASRLATLTTVRTEPVRLDGLNKTSSFERQVVYEFKSGILREERPPVFVSVAISEIPQPRLYANVPVEVRGIAPGDLNGTLPAAVEVRLEGPGTVMKTLEANQIKAFVAPDEETKKLKMHPVSVQIDLPEKIRHQVHIVDVNPSKVRLTM